MTAAISAHAAAPEDARSLSLLDAAFLVFARYGFRKTSMDELARAAQISRQGLYLRFANKEEVFRAVVRHVLARSLGAARKSLGARELELEARLVAAFDAWVGRWVGVMGEGASDLVEASNTLVGPLVAEHEALFVEAVAKALRASGLAAAYKPSGLSARQLSDTLCATARGLKYGCATRAAFVKSMGIAVRALCAPLARAS